MNNNITNHRLRLDAISKEENARLAADVDALKQRAEFTSLIKLLEQELVAERHIYEVQPASEFQRGQVVMLKKILTLLEE